MELEPLIQRITSDASGFIAGYKAAEQAVRAFQSQVADQANAMRKSMADLGNSAKPVIQLVREMEKLVAIGNKLEGPIRQAERLRDRLEQLRGVHPEIDKFLGPQRVPSNALAAFAAEAAAANYDRAVAARAAELRATRPIGLITPAEIAAQQAMIGPAAGIMGTPALAMASGRDIAIQQGRAALAKGIFIDPSVTGPPQVEKTVDWMRQMQRISGPLATGLYGVSNALRTVAAAGAGLTIAAAAMLGLDNVAGKVVATFTGLLSILTGIASAAAQAASSFMRMATGLISAGPLGQGVLAGLLIAIPTIGPSLVSWFGSLVGYVGSLSVGMVTIGTGMAMFVSLSKEAVTQAITLGIEYEKMRVKFEVLLGGGGRGSALFTQLQLLSRRTPYGVEQLGKGVETLLGGGVPEQNLVPMMGVLTEIGGGDPERLSRIVKAYTDAMAAGRLMGEEKRQFSNLGIGIADFAETADMSMDRFVGAMRRGEVGADVVTKTLVRLVQEGERFGGMSEKVLGTVGGSWDRLTKVFGQFLGSQGESGMKGLGVARILNDITDAFLDNWDLIAGKVKFVFDVIKMAAEEAFGFIKTAWRVLLGDIDFKFDASTLEGIRTGIRMVFKEIMDGIANVMGAFLKLVGFIEDNWGDSIRTALGIPLLKRNADVHLDEWGNIVGGKPGQVRERSALEIGITGLMKDLRNVGILGGVGADSSPLGALGSWRRLPVGPLVTALGREFGQLDTLQLGAFANPAHSVGYPLHKVLMGAGALLGGATPETIQKQWGLITQQFQQSGQMSPEAAKLLDETEKEFRTASPFAAFWRQRNLLKEAFGFRGRGPLAPEDMAKEDAQRRFGLVRAFEEQEKKLGLDKGVGLAPSMEFGSVAAMDAISRANAQISDPIERVAAGIDAMIEYHKEAKLQRERMAKALEKLDPTVVEELGLGED